MFGWGNFRRKSNFSVHLKFQHIKYLVWLNNEGNLQILGIYIMYFNEAFEIPSNTWNLQNSLAHSLSQKYDSFFRQKETR